MKFGLLTLFDYYPEDCSPQEYYRFLLDEIAYAEELGFDSVWMGEHHFCNYLCPSPQVFAAAVAQRTTRLRLGTAVALLPLHDPVRLAEDYAMVDVLSNGRLDFGVSRGFQKTSYDGFERSMDDSRERFAEGIDIIDKAWSQDSLSYEGQYRRLPNLSVLPRPVQRPRPPIWIGAGPTPESYELAAAHGYNILLASVFAPIQTFAPFVKLYRERLQEAGYDPSPMLRVQNPLSSDFEFMRTTLLPSLLQVVAENQEHARKQKLFEVAHVYYPKVKGQMSNVKGYGSGMQR